MLKREGLLEAELKRCIDEKYKFSAEIKAETTRSKWIRMWKHSTSDIRAEMVKRDDEWSIETANGIQQYQNDVRRIPFLKMRPRRRVKHVSIISSYLLDTRRKDISRLQNRYSSRKLPALNHIRERNWFWNI